MLYNNLLDKNNTMDKIVFSSKDIISDACAAAQTHRKCPATVLRSQFLFIGWLLCSDFARCVTCPDVEWYFLG